MRKLVGVLFAVGLASTSALGGTVEFSNPNPADPGESGVLLLDPGTSGFFDVTVDSIHNPAGSVDIIFLADLDGPESDSASNGLEFTGFTFSADFMSATFTQATSTSQTQVDGAREFKVGGASLFGAIPMPIQVGTLEVLAPADLAPGDYFVVVDNSREQFNTSKVGKSGADPDALFGSGTVRVTPEPATLALLGIGGLAVLRRRRTS